MTIGSNEHYEMLENFEKNFKGHRLDREDMKLWVKSQFYENGETNALFLAYSIGYAFGRLMYLY